MIRLVVLCSVVPRMSPPNLAPTTFKPAPPDFATTEAKERMTDGEMFYKISTGKRPMPPMTRKMNETERWQVVLFVRTLQPE